MGGSLEERNLSGLAPDSSWQNLICVPSLLSFPFSLSALLFGDLGVILDQELTFTQHVNPVSRSCFYQLRQLRVISRTLTPSAAATLVPAFVASRLDYCWETFPIETLFTVLCPRLKRHSG